jgi:hypothetical protein
VNRKMSKEKLKMGMQAVKRLLGKARRKREDVDAEEIEQPELTIDEQKKLDFCAFVLSKKFKYDKLMLASRVSTAQIEGREVFGYMERMFSDYDWLIDRHVMDRACYFALQDYQPIIHNFVDNYDFTKMYRSLVKLTENDFFRHFPNFEYNRLIVISSKPLKTDLTWISNYPWQTSDGYDTTVSFAPCNFLNMGSPLHDLPVLVLKDAIGKSELFFKAKTTAEDLTKQKDELIRKEIFKLREKEKNSEELIDELEIESEGARRMYHKLKYKMLNRAPYADEKEFEEFERKEMSKMQPFGGVNYKRIAIGIIIMIVIIILIVGIGLMIIPKPVQSAELPKTARLLISNVFKSGN